MTPPIVFEGWLSVLAALTGGNRDVYSIYVQRNKHHRSYPLLERYAHERSVPLSRVDEEVIAHWASGHSHGGIVAVVGERRYAPLPRLAEKSACPFVVMLDGIEDPFNLGQSIRALYAAGVDGVVLGERAWSTAAGVVARSSAGASEVVPTARVVSDTEAVDHFRGRGLLVAATAARARTTALYEADLTVPLFLVIGGERRGISRPLLQQADLLLHIPYGSAFDQSLGTTAAAAVLAFEVLRQRRE
ncbi:MAG: TrmH family RNA methyltransferase [Ardenticatenaceae bacterium]